jgi:hypothetical protein
MPRYFFNRTDGYVERDREGTELRDLSDARIQAIVFAGESLRDEPEKIWNGDDFRVEVTDDMGLLLFTVIASAIDAPSTNQTVKAETKPAL